MCEVSRMMNEIGEKKKSVLIPDLRLLVLCCLFGSDVFVFF